MSTTVIITNLCQIAEDYARELGLADFEIEQIIHSKLEGKDEWIIYLHFLEIDSLIEDDRHCAIIVIDAETEIPRLIEGL